MSNHHILELKKAPRVRLFACIKVVRDLGLERRETVRILSTAGLKNWEILSLVREDRERNTNGVLVVTPVATPSSYVFLNNCWKHQSRKSCFISFFKWESS